jgi:membrane-bound lytic murein transglycosylase
MFSEREKAKARVQVEPQDRMRVNVSTTSKGAQPEVTYEHHEGNVFMPYEERQQVIDMVLDDYGRMFREIEAAQMRQWVESVEATR